MERMYQEYKDLADFFLIYISEAHAVDGRRPVPYAKELGIREHTNYGERCVVATRLRKDKKLTLPCLVDGMDNAVEKQYQAFPDRIFVVRTDGKLAVAGKRGPRGFKPALSRTKRWLADFRKTGKEPPIVIPTDEPDFGEMQREMSIAYRDKNYEKALSLAQSLHDLDPEDAGTMYNMACMHSLLGHENPALNWLEKAIKAGYRDADHAQRDEDFKPLRDQPRFRELITQMRTQAVDHHTGGQAASGTQG